MISLFPRISGASRYRRPRGVSSNTLSARVLAYSNGPLAAPPSTPSADDGRRRIHHLDRSAAVHDTADNTVTLTTDNLIVGDWVRDHLLRDIETVARSHFGPDFRVITRGSRAAPADDSPRPARPPGSAPTRSTRPLHSTVLSSDRRTSSPPPPPRRSRNAPVRPTTRSTSMAVPVSARPTSCTPSPTVSIPRHRDSKWST